MTRARTGRWPRALGLLVLLAACGDDGEELPLNPYLRALVCGDEPGYG